MRLSAIAEVVGKGLRLPTRSITPAEAPAYFGWMAALAGLTFLEQVAPHGDKLRIPLGVGLILAGVLRF